MAERRIEVLEMCVSDLKNGFGNPRKISQAKREQLRQSIERNGDFGVIVIDENNDIIAGNQRVSVIKEINPQQTVLVKKLIGYSKAQKRAINIKDNTHSGDWDLDILAEWQADLQIDLGLDSDAAKKDKKALDGNKDMELIHYQKYDYVMIVCRYQTDYDDLMRKLDLKDKKVPICKTRKLKARAIWYDKLNVDIVPKQPQQSEEEPQEEEFDPDNE